VTLEDELVSKYVRIHKDGAAGRDGAFPARLATNVLVRLNHGFRLRPRGIFLAFPGIQTGLARVRRALMPQMQRVALSRGS
jgi:hypothetical protein